jgi:MotA/TolQ/ExbB proton channel family
VRRLLVQSILPFLLCLLPPAAAFVVWRAIPRPAWSFYVGHISTMDSLILGLGGSLFAVQILLSPRALRWRGSGFDERVDPWLNRLGQAAEWFPLLGLLGTVAAILQTFSAIEGPTAPEKIIQLYAPAITATGSGLFMALLNIIPLWVVMMGRDLIRYAGGGEGEVARDPAA